MKDECYIIPPTPTPNASPVHEETQDSDHETQVLEEDNDNETQMLGDDEETPNPESSEYEEDPQGVYSMDQPWQDVPIEPTYDIDYEKLEKMCWENFERIKKDSKQSYRDYLISLRDNTGDENDKYKGLMDMTVTTWNYISVVNNAPSDKKVAKCKELRDQLAKDVIRSMLRIDNLMQETKRCPDYEDPYVQVGVSMFQASVLRVKNKELTGQEKGLKSLYKSTDEAEKWSIFFRTLCNVKFDDKFVHQTFKGLCNSMLKPVNFHATVMDPLRNILCEPVTVLDDSMKEAKLKDKEIKKLKTLVLLSEKDQHFVKFYALGFKPSNPGRKRRIDGTEVYTEEYLKNNNGKEINKALRDYWIAEFDYQHKVVFYSNK